MEHAVNALRLGLQQHVLLKYVKKLALKRRTLQPPAYRRCGVAMTLDGSLPSSVRQHNMEYS